MDDRDRLLPPNTPLGQVLAKHTPLIHMHIQSAATFDAGQLYGLTLEWRHSVENVTRWAIFDHVCPSRAILISGLPRVWPVGVL